MNQSKASIVSKPKSADAREVSALPVLSGMKDAQGQPLKLDVPQDVLQRLRAMG